MPADISPLMDHPGWKTITPAQRKQALDLWQDPSTTENDRAEMRLVMDRWAADAAQEPSAPASLVCSVGGILQDAPGWVNRCLGVLGRAADKPECTHGGRTAANAAGVGGRAAADAARHYRKASMPSLA